MRQLIGILAAAAAALTLPVAADAKPRLTGEAKLAKLLEGRVAGKPQDCIYLPQVRSSRIINDTAIVFDAGSTLWVNRPRSGASSLDEDDIQVTDTHSSQLCSVDIVRLHDRTSFFYTGFVGLGDFVPYRKVKTASRY